MIIRLIIVKGLNRRNKVIVKWSKENIRSIRKRWNLSWLIQRASQLIKKEKCVICIGNDKIRNVDEEIR
jgi:hypothetical protein